jgi:putative peptidoglycan lipid II flippase
MLPVALTLGLFNLSLLIDSLIGTLVQPQGPAAIDRSFRIIGLPQGMFSLAISTVMFPALARLAARGALDDVRRATMNGARQICLFAIPSAAILIVLAQPITRLLYQRGAFDSHATNLVSAVLVIWALVLPLQGLATFFSQTFFVVARPWVTTAVATGYLLVNALIGLALYRPLGLQGVVLATVIANLAMTVAKASLLRPILGGLEGRATVSAVARMIGAALPLAGGAYGIWVLLDDALGRSTIAQLTAIGAAVTAGALAYGIAVSALRIPEATQVRQMLRRVLRSSPAGTAT